MSDTRIQKKMEPGWDPLKYAHECVGYIHKALDKCDAPEFIAATGCAFGNAEAAFYEKQASEDEMNTIKDMASDLRGEFTIKCKCVSRE